MEARSQKRRMLGQNAKLQKVEKAKQKGRMLGQKAGD